MTPFTKETIHATVGAVIASSNQCKHTIKTIRLKKHLFICKLYDTKGVMLREYSKNSRTWIKELTRDMHMAGEGSVEHICRPQL